MISNGITKLLKYYLCLAKKSGNWNELRAHCYQSWLSIIKLILTLLVLKNREHGVIKMVDFSVFSSSLHSCLSACCAATAFMKRISSACGWGRQATPAYRYSFLNYTSLPPWSAVSSTRSSTQVRSSYYIPKMCFTLLNICSVSLNNTLCRSFKLSFMSEAVDRNAPLSVIRKNQTISLAQLLINTIYSCTNVKWCI